MEFVLSTRAVSIAIAHFIAIDTQSRFAAVSGTLELVRQTQVLHKKTTHILLIQSLPVLGNLKHDEITDAVIAGIR